MCNMGRNLRLRYKRLLPTDTTYTNESLRVLSSSQRRCVASVKSLLSGLLSSNLSKMPPRIPWASVAVNVLPSDTDYVRGFMDMETWNDMESMRFNAMKLNISYFMQMLQLWSAACPKYDEIYEKFLSDPDLQTVFYKENRKLVNFYAYLTKHSGS